MHMRPFDPCFKVGALADCDRCHLQKICSGALHMDEEDRKLPTRYQFLFFVVKVFLGVYGCVVCATNIPCRCALRPVLCGRAVWVAPSSAFMCPSNHRRASQVLDGLVRGAAAGSSSAGQPRCGSGSWAIHHVARIGWRGRD